MTTKKKVRRAPPERTGPEWHTAATLICRFTRMDRELHVHIMNVIGSSEWQIMALEGARGPRTAEDFFDDHAHKMLPSAFDMKSAIDYVEAYGKAWQEQGQPAAGACACKEIPRYDVVAPEHFPISSSGASR